MALLPLVPSYLGVLCIHTRIILIYHTNGVMSMMTAKDRCQIIQGQNIWQDLLMNLSGDQGSFILSHIYLVIVTHTHQMKNMYMVKKVIYMHSLVMESTYHHMNLEAMSFTSTQLRSYNKSLQTYLKKHLEQVITKFVCNILSITPINPIPNLFLYILTFFTVKNLLQVNKLFNFSNFGHL